MRLAHSDLLKSQDVLSVGEAHRSR